MQAVIVVSAVVIVMVSGLFILDGMQVVQAELILLFAAPTNKDGAELLPGVPNNESSPCSKKVSEEMKVPSATIW